MPLFHFDFKRKIAPSNSSLERARANPSDAGFDGRFMCSQHMKVLLYTVFKDLATAGVVAYLRFAGRCAR
jgi:hypothetical protein